MLKNRNPRYFTFHFISVLIISFFGAFGSIRVSNAHPHLTTSSKVAVNGIGPILLGMTVEEAEAAAGIKIVLSSPGDISIPHSKVCRYYRPQEKSLQGILFIVDLENNNRIVRMEFSNKQTSTISGIKIGDTREKVRNTYPGQISETQDPYREIALIYKAIDPAYKKYGLLFNFLQRTIGTNKLSIPSNEDPLVGFRIAKGDWINELVELCT